MIEAHIDPDLGPTVGMYETEQIETARELLAEERCEFALHSNRGKFWFTQSHETWGSSWTATNAEAHDYGS